MSALASLRSKKFAETTLIRRSEMLAQLEQVYTNIGQAADQVEIVRVMEASTVVLKGLHAEVGGAERVEQVVEELREEMSNVDEVGKIIAEVGDPSLVVDDEEVDDELEAMEREEKEKRDEVGARETARRLAALDGKSAGITAEREKKWRENVGSETDIEESIAALGGMSLEETQTTQPKPAIERTTLSAT
jgi:charged multivesicular body protein 7